MLQLHDYGADVVENDNVSVICMANNVSASLSWLDAYMNPLQNTGEFIDLYFYELLAANFV